MEIELTPMELRLLEHLMLNAGKVVTRGELHDKVWDMHFDPSSNLVDAHVARLRKKLNLANAGVSLVTRRGMGFVLDAGESFEGENAVAS
jgi:DNA-binding response OmpR family regulator